MKKRKIIIGSRGSKLALLYAEKAKKKLIEFFDDRAFENIDIKKISTEGDSVTDRRVSEIGGKGSFSKNIENELIGKKIDLAVHALKDMPCDETEGLITNCFLERNDSREVLISKNKISLDELSEGALIGTSSYRREFQLKNKRSDIDCKLIRGNIDTRINKLNNGLYDAIILSLAGINFLQLTNYVSQIFSTSELIPSAGQGIIALQCREDDIEMLDLLKKVNHEPTYKRAAAERSVLKVLEGDCETAVGVHSKINDENIELEAELFSIDGKKRYYKKMKKKISQAKDLGLEVGEILKQEANNSYKK